MAKIVQIMAELSKVNPTPRTELDYTTPFTLLAAVLLSAQSTDKQVNIATKDLFMVADTPEKMASLDIKVIENYIKSIGLYKTKARNLLATAQILADQYESTIPDKREILDTLPGVGRKTATVVLNELYHIPTIAVDTHIFRVSNRLGIASGKTPLEVEKKLLSVIPDNYKLFAHHHIILHGRYV